MVCNHTWASKSPIIGFRGEHSVHKGILAFIFYYIGFDLRGGGGSWKLAVTTQPIHDGAVTTADTTYRGIPVHGGITDSGVKKYIN